MFTCISLFLLSCHSTITIHFLLLHSWQLYTTLARIWPFSEVAWFLWSFLFKPSSRKCFSSEWVAVIHLVFFFVLVRAMYLVFWIYDNCCDTLLWVNKHSMACDLSGSSPSKNRKHSATKLKSFRQTSASSRTSAMFLGRLDGFLKCFFPKVF